MELRLSGLLSEREKVWTLCGLRRGKIETRGKKYLSIFNHDKNPPNYLPYASSSFPTPQY